jgi:hypothetical protein
MHLVRHLALDSAVDGLAEHRHGTSSHERARLPVKTFVIVRNSLIILLFSLVFHDSLTTTEGVAYAGMLVCFVAYIHTNQSVPSAVAPIEPQRDPLIVTIKAGPDAPHSPESYRSIRLPRNTDEP